MKGKSTSFQPQHPTSVFHFPIYEAIRRRKSTSKKRETWGPLLVNILDVNNQFKYQTHELMRATLSNRRRVNLCALRMRFEVKILIEGTFELTTVCTKHILADSGYLPVYKLNHTCSIR
jgi:ABC-type uncharacterized transport system ATPase subunit